MGHSPSHVAGRLAVRVWLKLLRRSWDWIRYHFNGEVLWADADASGMARAWHSGQESKEQCDDDAVREPRHGPMILMWWLVKAEESGEGTIVSVAIPPPPGTATGPPVATTALETSVSVTTMSPVEQSAWMSLNVTAVTRLPLSTCVTVNPSASHPAIAADPEPSPVMPRPPSAAAAATALREAPATIATSP